MNVLTNPVMRMLTVLVVVEDGIEDHQKAKHSIVQRQGPLRENQNINNYL